MLAKLRDTPIQRWVFDEIKTVKKLKFDNADKEKIMNHVLSLASKMQYYDIADVLVQPYLLESFQPDIIHRFIHSLQTANLRIYLQSKSLEGACDLTEPIYQTKYSCEKLAENILSAFASPDISFATSGKSLAFPPVNPFIPKSTEVLADRSS